MVELLFPLVWTGIVLLGVPLQSGFVRRRLERDRPSRAHMYVSTVLGLLVLGAVTLALDLAGSHGALAAYATPVPFLVLLAWAGGTLAACVMVLFVTFGIRKLLDQREGGLVVTLLPRTDGELAGFVVLALVAGIVEEYVYRGFCFQVLSFVSGSVQVASLVVALGFGLAHGYQTPVGILRATVLGALLSVPVLLTGSLVPSAIAHAGIDIFSGAYSLPLLRRWNLVEETDAPMSSHARERSVR
jgi:membrane protease YdiL (CAAX protease family)